MSPSLHLTHSPLPRTLNNSMEASVGKTIPVVEGDQAIAQLVQLQKEGFRSITTMSEVGALEKIKGEKQDLIVRDLMLSGADRLDVCQHVRPAPDAAKIPVIMLTASAQESDTIVGLDLGADDYVTEPFGPTALVARVRALLHRTDLAPSNGVTHYRYGPLSMNPARHEIDPGQQNVPISRLKQKLPLLEDAVVSVKSLGYQQKDSD